MSLFKIKLIPKVKERGWEVRGIRNNRKQKVCEICGKLMSPGEPSTTFTKRTTTGTKTEYETHHTCPDTTPMADCSNKMGKKLGINVAECWIN